MRGALLTVLLLGLGGCGPTLRIRHLDPTHPQAEVHVDGQIQTYVSHGDDVSLSVEPGPHRLRVVPVSQDKSPWHPGADHLDVVIEGDAVLTLQPVRQGS
jgi:hypothetical protein